MELLFLLVTGGIALWVSLYLAAKSIEDYGVILSLFSYM